MIKSDVSIIWTLMQLIKMPGQEDMLLLSSNIMNLRNENIVNFMQPLFSKVFFLKLFLKVS